MEVKLIDSNLDYKLNDNFDISLISELPFLTVEMNVHKSCDVTLNIENKNENKLVFIINLDDNVTLNLNEIKKGTKLKYQSKINLNNSTINITKLNDLESINECSLINLNKENATINYILKTVSKNMEKYDININHNASNTNSNIVTNGLNIEKGKLNITVTTIVNNGKVKCVANQTNRIINLTLNNCKIRPNLLIDEQDVIANHSALIGNFSDEELFYIKRLGINHNDTLNLLIKGFLQNNIPESLSEQLFSKYWRGL